MEIENKGEKGGGRCPIRKKEERMTNERREEGGKGEKREMEGIGRIPFNPF